MSIAESKVHIGYIGVIGSSGQGSSHRLSLLRESDRVILQTSVLSTRGLQGSTRENIWVCSSQQKRVADSQFLRRRR